MQLDKMSLLERNPLYAIVHVPTVHARRRWLSVRQRIGSIAVRAVHFAHSYPACLMHGDAHVASYFAVTKLALALIRIAASTF